MIGTIYELPQRRQAIEWRRRTEAEFYAADETHPGFSEWYAQAERVFKEQFPNAKAQLSSCFTVRALLTYFRPLMSDKNFRALFDGPLDPEFEEDEHEACACCGCTCGGDN